MAQNGAYPDPASTQNNAYLAAISNVNSVLAYMTGVANQFLSETNGSIAELGAWTPTQEGTPPDLRPPMADAGTPEHFDPPDPNLFGDVGSLTLPDWDDLTRLIGDVQIEDVGPFTPTIGIPTMPPPPGPIDVSGRPTDPVLGDVTIPTAPDMSLPAMDALSPITLPDVPTITVPAFDVDDIPLFDQPVPNLSFTWSEPAYQPVVANEIAATVKAMLAGGFAMPKVVQDALFAAARDREDMVAQKAVEDAYDDWAARGFFMPPGMLVEQVNAAREQSALRNNSLSRDVFTKAAEWQIENLRTAVAQGIVLEQAWMNLWDGVQRRSLEAAKETVELAKDQFNLYAAAFNLNLQRVAAQREVFEARLRAELAKLDILKAEIEAEQLVGQINEQKVRIYTARVGAVQTMAQVYNTQLQGAELQYNVKVKGPMDLYRSRVEAWATGVKAQESLFTAYDAQARGIDALSRGYEAQARGYAATVQAASDRNRARLGVLETTLAAVRESVQKFLGLLQGNVAVINAKRDQIDARARSYAADTARWGEQLKYASESQRLKMTAQTENTRNTMAYFETLSRQFDARMQRLLVAGNSVKEALQAAGQMAAQMAAGAMSAIHAQSSVQGSGSVNTSYDYKYDMDT
jgi:hypothetical protein